MFHVPIVSDNHGRCKQKHRVYALLLAAALVQACASPGPGAFRDPGFQPRQIRRPAVHLTVSLDKTGFLGEGEFSAQERAALPEAYETALLLGLNAEGVLPVDIALTPNRAYRGSQPPFESTDRARALERGRGVNADHVLIVDVRLSRLGLVHCRDSGRPFVAPTTVAQAGVELLRVRDGGRLLLEPPGPDLETTDIEADCEARRIARRLSAQELLEASVGQVLKLLLER